MSGMPFRRSDEDTDPLPAFQNTPRSLWSKAELEEAQMRRLSELVSGSPYFDPDNPDELDTDPAIPVVHPSK